MPLSTEQHETIYNLVYKSTRHGYRELRDELYDHFVSGVVAAIEGGMSFTEAVHSIYQGLGAGVGVRKIETDYVETIKKSGKTFYWKFAKQYLCSFRWFAAVLSAALLHFVFASLPVSLGIFILALYVAAAFYGRWFFQNFSVEGSRRSVYYKKKDLKASVVYRIYSNQIAIVSLLGVISSIQHDETITMISTFAALAILDFSVAFINGAKGAWFSPEMKVA